ncbi:MAG: hypothetical protein QOK37_3977 [Thermoanaerobaculia bacterium]|jgi:hypothetical protein|nr:hypothetical protein [Thermoanaerobaculia bacterium]
MNVADEDRRIDSSLAIVQPHLPAVLVAPESLDRIRTIAHVLPTFAVDFFGFESRLGEGDAPTDCAINLTPDGARMLAGRYPTPAPPEMRGAPWDRLERFYQAWGETRTPPYSDAGSTWLEFDTSSPVLMPNLLFGHWPSNPDVHRPLDWLLDVIIPDLLGGAPLAPAFRENVVRCIEERPGGSDDFQIGVMFSRNIQAVRICVFDLPSDGLVTYLARIGWKGPIEEALTWIERLQPHADFVGLHLDVGEKVYPQIGIEPNFVAGCWSRQPHKEPRWSGQFDVLQANGLMTAQKREALMNWIGHDEITIDDRDALLLRGLSHLKLVIRPGAPTIAKAYFGLAHRILNVPAAAAAS